MDNEIIKQLLGNEAKFVLRALYASPHMSPQLLGELIGAMATNCYLIGKNAGMEEGFKSGRMVTANTISKN